MQHDNNRTKRMAQLIWETLEPDNRPVNEHQVLVTRRHSLARAVRDDIRKRLRDTGGADQKLRCVTVGAPDNLRSGLCGLWMRVLEALGEPEPSNPDRNGPKVHQLALEAAAIKAETAWWKRHGHGIGRTILFVYAIDQWYREIVRNDDDWALRWHLQNERNFIILGCADQWPPEGTPGRPAITTLQVRHLDPAAATR